MLPENAPAEYSDRAVLWNAVEKIEKAKNAQLAREVRLALPAEFTFEQNLNLVREYVRENFVRHGMCADVALHIKNDGNPHTHILLTMRSIEKDGSWAAKSKMEYILDDNGERIKLASGRYKTRKLNATDWDERSKAEEWRESWANIVNAHLENGGYVNRVDHRSYERQGVEQIPTIHMGVSAHQMEQKGIKTERGDTNRRIKATNAKLKNIDSQLHEIKNSPTPQMIIDLEKSIKAQNSPGYANWAKIFNLQQAAQTLLYIQENGIADIESLETAHHESKNAHADIQKQINTNRGKIKSLSNLKKQAEIYRKTLKVYENFNAPGQFKRFKDDSYARHKAEIEEHIAARAYIYDELKLKKFPNLKELSGEISKLYEKEEALRQAQKSAKEQMTALTVAEHNIHILLGYRELENHKPNPVPISKAPQLVPVYKPSFVEAEKAGELGAYYQNIQLNRECVAAIQSAVANTREVSPNKKTAIYNMEVAVNESIALYGAERIGWVLVAVIMGDTFGKFTDHKSWATQAGLPSEPCNIQFNMHEALINGFTARFREEMETKFTTINQSRTPSFSEKMANAGREADEHNRDRATPAQRKSKKSGYEL